MSGGLILCLLWPVWLAGVGSESLSPDRIPEPGTSVRRGIGGDEIHRYSLPPGRNGALWITVDQVGVDLTVSALGAEGEVLLTVDSPGGLWGEEWLYLPGVEVRPSVAIAIGPRSRTSARGHYRLEATPRDPTGTAPHPRRDAEQAVTEAGRFVHTDTPAARDQALDFYRRALASWQALELDTETARTFFVLAILLREQGQPDEALPRLRQALGLWRDLGDRRGVAQTLTEIANTSHLAGGTRHLEEVYLEALGHWRELGDLQGQARTLNQLGLGRARHKPLEALTPYTEALALFRQVGDTRLESIVLNNLGGLRDLLGEPHQALARYQQALGVLQRLGDRRQEAAVWNNIASLHRRIGRFEEALAGFEASLEVRRELGDLRGQGRVLNNLGRTWLALGDRERARDLFEQALELRRRSGDRRGESITLHNLGEVHAELSRWELALDFGTQARELSRVLGDRRRESTTLIALGRAAAGTGRLGEARRYLEEAARILEELGNPWRQATAWRALGKLLTEAGEPAEARAVLERASEVYRVTADAVGEGETRLELARVERAVAATIHEGPRAERHLVAAWDQAMAALDHLETVRGTVDSLGLRASFLSRHEPAFELAIEVAMELDQRRPEAGWAARALEVSERARARSFLDLLEGSTTGPQGVGVELLVRQRELLESLDAKVDRRRRQLDRAGSSAEADRLASEIRRVLDQLDQLEAEIRRQSPGWDALLHPRPIRASDVQALLDADTTLLEYSLGEARGFLWRVTTDRVEGFELPDRLTVETMARKATESLRILDPGDPESDRDALTRLGELLLGPVWRSAGGGASPPDGQRLVVVADDALHYVPFAALPHPSAPDEPLLARHEVVSLPSASALAAQRRLLADRPEAAKRLAVLADPVFDASDPRLPALAPEPGGLPKREPATMADHHAAYRDSPAGPLRLERLVWSRWEAEKLAAHAEGQDVHLALGFEADLTAVRSGRLRGYRIVHFATHGVVEAEHPELSALVLSLYDRQGDRREGILRLPEIYHLDLDAELVVLSGCRTALGREVRGEGMIGLTRGFFAAGARSLVASLWRVQDHSTARLMDHFYRRLLDPERPMRPAEALRAAQLELLRDPELGDPYHWAAFAIYGEWR